MSSEHTSGDPDSLLPGEANTTDMRRPFAEHANNVIRGLLGTSQRVNLGKDLGEVDVNKLRFRDALEEGHLRAYVRQEAGEHKVIISTVVALGIVAAGIHTIKHHKK